MAMLKLSFSLIGAFLGVIFLSQSSLAVSIEKVDALDWRGWLTDHRPAPQERPRADLPNLPSGVTVYASASHECYRFLLRLAAPLGLRRLVPEPKPYFSITASNIREDLPRFVGRRIEIRPMRETQLVRPAYEIITSVRQMTTNDLRVITYDPPRELSQTIEEQVLSRTRSFVSPLYRQTYYAFEGRSQVTLKGILLEVNQQPKGEWLVKISRNNRVQTIILGEKDIFLVHDLGSPRDFD